MECVLRARPMMEEREEGQSIEVEGREDEGGIIGDRRERDVRLLDLRLGRRTARQRQGQKAARQASWRQARMKAQRSQTLGDDGTCQVPARMFLCFFCALWSLALQCSCPLQLSNTAVCFCELPGQGPPGQPTSASPSETGS